MPSTLTSAARRANDGMNRPERRGARRVVGEEAALTDDSTVDFGLLPDLVGRQLRVAQLLAFKDFALEIDGMSFNSGSFEILELLAHNPDIGQSRLAAAIGIEKSSLVPAITRLEDLGLIRRRASTIDKRSNQLRITHRGRKTLDRLRIHVRQRDVTITRGMSARNVTTLNRLLKEIAAINA